MYVKHEYLIEYLEIENCISWGWRLLCTSQNFVTSNGNLINKDSHTCTTVIYYSEGIWYPLTWMVYSINIMCE